ncbi:PREDICTED: uncharacterized protein LOC105458000 isoform X2 [Wasmannia auropunctata]|uniref:uncharacterized protein LOC105458000 isoform X2 n=1 Tax=Wasmannia auropunctata TaxID=64793 RepID=UPI0005EF6173|nr:PREDICTED: uncharacterized protein LOC105458000 isoform X2 [Wasmannia auropunctata]
MLEANYKGSTERMPDGVYKIYVQEPEELGPKQSQNSQMYIEFNDLCYSIHNRKDKRSRKKFGLIKLLGYIGKQIKWWRTEKTLYRRRNDRQAIRFLIRRTNKRS